MSCMVTIIIMIIIIVVIDEVVVIRVIKQVSGSSSACAQIWLKYSEIRLNSTRNRINFEYIYI